jgi:hypothetical protein
MVTISWRLTKIKFKFNFGEKGKKVLWSGNKTTTTHLLLTILPPKAF